MTSRASLRRTTMLCGALALLSAPGFAADSAVADAAEKRDPARVRTLLQNGADVQKAQPDGMTALHWAAYLDDLDTAKALAGADPNATNRYGVTPLSLACQNGSTAMVELLLAMGADPNFALRGGETPLMTAARTGQPGAVAALLSKGAQPEAKDRRGQTAMMWAAGDGHPEVVKLLLAAGADFRTPLPASGFTPLFFAARNGHLEVVRALLGAGADANEAMVPQKPGGKGVRKGTSALLLAVENGHFELALALLQAGADPNDQRSGFTPLHAMSWVRKPNRGEDDGDPIPQGSGNLTSDQFIRKLVEHGADVNARLTSGKGGAGLYSKAGATPFLMAAATADTAYLRLLVELGANPALGNVDGCTPLMVAAGIGIGGAAANEVAGEEPEVLETAQLLLDLGADVNAVDATGETAMHGAAYKNLPKVIQFLAEKGARVEVWNRKNKYGWTPLMIAEGHRPGNFKPSAETAAALHPLLASAAQSEEGKADQTVRAPQEIEFAQVDGQSLKLDLYQPPTASPRAPLIVWIHGGAWRGGSRADMPLKALVAAGYAIASVDYRLSTQARFPAQIHDLKAAIRFLRAQREMWNLQTEQIVVAGNSAGGHLAALVGVSNGHAELEGTVGADLEKSSAVQGMISFYGGSNLTTILSQSTPHGLSVRVPALDLLLGGQPDQVPALARLASPVAHVDPTDPPLLLIHGDQDPQMPLEQSRELLAAYQAVGAPADLLVIPGAVHGGAAFYDEERMAAVKGFLQRHFRR